MTRDDDFIGQLEAYLDEYEGLTPLPHGVRDAVRAQLPTTKQIGPVSGLMRDLYMNRSIDTPARWGLVAAVIIGAVIIGGALFFGRPNVGGPPPVPSTSPSEAAVASEPPGPVAFAAIPQGTRLSPGDYAFTHIPGVTATFTLPSGWERNIPDFVVWSVDDDKATMSLMTVDNVYIDPCQTDLGLLSPAVGPTVDDLVAALGNVPGLTFSEPVDVALGGATGMQLEYVPPDGFNSCQPDSDDILLFSVNNGTAVLPAPNGADPVTMWILDVDGTRVVVIAAPTVSRAGDLDGIVNSIQFE